MTNLKSIILGLSLATVLLFSCQNKAGSIDNINKVNHVDVIKKIYSIDSLETQTFTIDNSIDNLITGASGTVIRINRNVFVDQEGKAITGKVEIELIEALTPSSMVLANLTTTFEGKPLETGGMIYLNAKSNNKEISIASDKSVQIKMPTDSALIGMSVFEGEKDSLGIKWINPVKLPLDDTIGGISIESFEKTTNIAYSVDGFVNPKDYPNKVNMEVGRIAWEGDGLKIMKDSVLKIYEFTVRFYKQEKFFTWNQFVGNAKGANSFAEDRKTNYIFSLKKLGWANIDRLLGDPRTREVELITSIENEKDFEFVYVTLITQKMYLPGYQKKDKTFCFSHNDEEKQQLPVGETATILATAYKNDKPYFAFQKITITDKQTVAFKLEETTTEKLKATLKEKI